MNVLDEDRLGTVASELGERIALASCGETSWLDVGLSLQNVLPGSAAAIVDYDVSAHTVRSSFAPGIEPEFFRSYSTYYSSINPWIGFWIRQPACRVLLSEETYPTRLLEKTEFYADWLRPQAHMHAAAGMRVDGGPNDLVHLTWHYPIAYAPEYDRVAAAVLTRLSGRLASAAEFAVAMREGVEQGLRQGALVERVGEIAIVVDGRSRLLEANDRAVAALSKGEPIASAGGLLALRHPQAHRWLIETIARLAAGEFLESQSMVFVDGEAVYRASVAIVPRMGERHRMLIPTQDLLLVTVKRLSGATLRLDDVALRISFGLSLAEVRLCEALMSGLSLQEAAIRSGVSVGTLRQRAKAVFRKTRTHRQGELIALLAQFGGRS